MILGGLRSHEIAQRMRQSFLEEYGYGSINLWNLMSGSRVQGILNPVVGGILNGQGMWSQASQNHVIESQSNFNLQVSLV